jgi:hypothetical protein
VVGAFYFFLTIADRFMPRSAVRRLMGRLWRPPPPPDAEYHALQTGHLALEDKAAEIAALMRDFLARSVRGADRLERPTPNPDQGAEGIPGRVR